ncbi:MAG TPA: low molecular weight protein-tyrosine-phosphatase [Candidatus Desulfobacillus sp.]|nr:low molecular weight protein-tyrosine-phosphatase [Candidatus Desulfobacillus sp.]
MIRILFVCAGNICRSPTAEGVLAKYLSNNKIEELFKVDSAGINGYHIGEAPDPRACAAAFRRGIDISGQRARKLIPTDFERFDLLLAMDRENLGFMRCGSRPEYHGRLGLFTDYSPRFRGLDVPDPYYGDDEGFELVLDMAEDAATGLVERLAGKRSG